MAKLTITRGYPGSGKTTWAKGQAGNVRINRDDLRHALYRKTGVLSREEEERVTVAQRVQVTALLKAGIDVVVDDTNLNLRFARDFADIAAKVGAEFQCFDFEVPVETCVDQDLTRMQLGGRYVTGAVIRNMARRYPMEQWKPVTPRVTLTPEWIKWEPDWRLPYAVLTDIDGTLADHEGLRSPYDFSKVGGDRPIQHAIDAVRAMAIHHRVPIIALSGRDDSCRDDTLAWLRSNRIDPDELHMRKTGDKRRDDIVKHEIFHNLIAPHHNALALFDDRLQVCRMWNSIGAPLFRVGDPDADF